MEQLYNLDKSYVNRIVGRYPSWHNDNMYEIQIGQHVFGYHWDETTAFIDEYFREGVKEDVDKTANMSSFPNIIRLTEGEFHSMICESVMGVLRNKFGWLR